jgi:hypothetical protein
MALVRRLERRLDEICKGMIAQMRREYPEYADVPDHARQVELVRLIAHAFVGVAMDARGLSGEELAQLASIGGESARYGISLDTLVGGARLAMRLAWLYGVEEARGMSPPEVALDALEEVALALFNFVDDLTVVLHAGYRDQAERARMRESGPSGLLAALFGGSSLSQEEIGRRATEIGLDTRADYGLLLITDPRGEAGAAGVIAVSRLLALQFAGAIEVDLTACSPKHVALVSPAPSRGAWSKAVRAVGDIAGASPVLVLGSMPESGLTRLTHRYRRMAATIGLAGLVYPERRLVRSDELRVFQLLAGSAEERREFVEEALGEVLALPANRRNPLLKTAEALYEAGGRADAAAAALHVHVKTVGYRMGRIEQLTGLRPHANSDRLRLDLALHLLRLSGGIERWPPG